MTTQLEAMTTAYNSIKDYIKDLSDSDPTLANTMKSVQRSLKNYMASDKLVSLGVTTDWKTGDISFDSDTFSEAYASDPDGVKTALLGDDDSEGIMSRMDDYLTEQLDSSSGFFVTKEKTINKKVAKLEDSIDAMETRLAKRQETLEAQFAALETLMSSLNSTSDYLTSFFESYSSSS
jgi:flagellar hook-associated protein 2